MKAEFHFRSGSKITSGNKDWLMLDYIYLWDIIFLGLVSLSLVLASSLGQDVVHLGTWGCINLNKVESYRFGGMENFKA